MADEKYIGCQDLENNLMIFFEIKNIYLLGDGASWIRESTKELRLNPANNVNFYLCEFHFKQAIHLLFSVFDKSNITSIPVLKRGEVTPTYDILHHLFFY